MIPDRQIQEARTRRPLSAVIGGDVKLIHRHGEWMGLCPFHKERTPSFTVVDGKGFYHCFGCGAHGDAISWRMEFHNESFREAVETLSGESLPAGEVREPALRIAEQQMHSAGYSAKARALWDEAVQIAGTPGDGYFRGRGITIPLPPSLRYHARCVRGSGEHRRLLPAVVCNVQDLEGRTVAVHRIYLEPSSFTGIPRKIGSAPDKALLGSPGTGSIRLAEAAPSMGRAEGVETSLAVMQATHVPIWSAIHAGHMPKMAIPPEVEAIYTFADRDPVSWRPGPLYGKRPGEHFAKLAAKADIAAGRRALVVWPEGTKVDFNDMLQEAG